MLVLVKNTDFRSGVFIVRLAIVFVMLKILTDEIGRCDFKRNGLACTSVARGEETSVCYWNLGNVSDPRTNQSILQPLDQCS